MKAKENKTNAMRVLDRAKIPYETYSYEHEDGKIDGVSVAQKLGQPVEQVFKTLVTRGTDRNFYVFVIPVAKELNLKAQNNSKSNNNSSDILFIEYLFYWLEIIKCNVEASTFTSYRQIANNHIKKYFTKNPIKFRLQNTYKVA